MPTFGPGARRVPRRAPLQSEPPGGLVRPRNTWPDDRPTPGGGSSRRSAVIALDSPVRWPAVTRLPLRAPGGGRAARPRPTPMPTFGPGARRVPRRAPLQSEPPGGLVRPRNTWPDDRPTPGGGSSRRSAVIALDSPVRWPAVTCLPFRVRQHHKAIPHRYVTDPGNTANVPPARRPGRWRAGERAQFVVHREVTGRREQRIQRRIHP